MPDVRAVNLNLLLVLEALLETRSVTRAGARLGLTQSGTSNALAELRRILGDPLFERRGGEMHPTPRALGMAPHVRQGIAALRAALADPGFDPAVARRRFVLAAPDFVQLAILPALARALAARAPGVDLQVVTWASQRVPEGLSTGEVDLFAGFVDHIPPGCGSAVLFDDRYVVLLRHGHPALHARGPPAEPPPRPAEAGGRAEAEAGGRAEAGGPAGPELSLERWLELGHVVVTDQPGGTTSVDRALADRGLRRRIALRVQSFLLVPPLVAATDLVASVDSRVAAPFVARGDVVAVPPPLRLPQGRVRLVWDARADEDPAAAWFRAEVSAAGAGP